MSSRHGELLKSCGNEAFKRKCFARASCIYLAGYDAATTAGDAPLRVALASNLAAAFLGMEDWAAAEQWARRGLEPELAASKEMRAKLEKRLADAQARPSPGGAGATAGGAEALREEGNRAFEKGDLARARAAYLQAAAAGPEIASTLAWLKLAANLALVSLRLLAVGPALEWCEAGLGTAASAEGPEADGLREKLARRKASAGLLQEVFGNYRASLLAAPKRPTRFTPALGRAVYSEGTVPFFAGQFAERTGGSRFLATAGVLTCVAIFAWAPAGKGKGSQGKGLGCHIPVGAILSGCLRRLRQGSSGHILQELVEALKSCFEGVAREDVEVHVLGGHACEDRNSCLAKHYFPNEPQKQLISWHVLDAVRAAGLERINIVMLNRFVGEPCISQEVELRLRSENQRFVCAALDCESGCIVTHTEEATGSVPASWWQAESACRPSVGGQPLRSVAAGPLPENEQGGCPAQ